MAEGFPAKELDPDEKVVSALLLAQFDTYGLSTINKSLVNNLRLVDPEAKTIKITCALVEEEEKIKDEDVTDAKNCGVVLKGAKCPMRRKKQSKPDLQWLDEYQEPITVIFTIIILTSSLDMLHISLMAVLI